MTYVKFVYSVSDKANLVSQTIKSMKSLRKFIDKDNIIAFYTPPRSESGFRKVSQLAIVKKAPNLTKPFVFNKARGLARYGEKVHLCDVDSPNVVYLDAGAIIKKNPLGLLNGDFDFSARQGSANRDFNEAIWNSMFSEIGKEPIPMPNPGFMIFKNYCHKQIREEWLKLIDTPLRNPHPKNYFKEQYALALAISGKKIKWMSAHEHAFRWENEERIDTYVLHGTKKFYYHAYYKLNKLLKIVLHSKLVGIIRKGLKQ